MIREFIISELFDTYKTIATELFKDIEYPWEVLTNIKDFILKLGQKLNPLEYTEVKKNVWISNDTKIYDSALIEAPTIIQSGSEIRHCAYIRGSVIVGENCVVGNSTELKNSILFNDVQVPHYNYVGDSILGYKVHLGAGVILSNLRSDKQNVKIRFNDGAITTGIRKIGAIIGDYSEIGCNAVLNPGTIIGKNSAIYPLSMVRGYVPKNVIFKNDGSIIQKK